MGGNVLLSAPFVFFQSSGKDGLKFCGRRGSRWNLRHRLSWRRVSGEQEAGALSRTIDGSACFVLIGAVIQLSRDFENLEAHTARPATKYDSLPSLCEWGVRASCQDGVLREQRG